MASEERRDMDSRLLNWSTWCTTWGGYPRGRSQTGTLCDRLRRAAGGVHAPEPERRQIDKADALLVEQVMRALSTENRMLLWWWYIRREKRHIICRMMRIPHWPESELDDRLIDARAAVERLVALTRNTTV